MPGRLPTTKDFPSTVKLSIVPRKYVSHHSATPSSSSVHLDPEPLPSLSDTCGEERLSGADIQASKVWTPALRAHGSTLASAARKAHHTIAINHYQSFEFHLADGNTLEQRPRMTLRPTC